MNRRTWGGAPVFFGLFAAVLFSGHAWGDTAEVLPKGVFRASVTYNGYSPIDTRFDPDGNKESISKDFNSNLNSNVFPDLGLIEAGFGMDNGTASIGTSVVDFRYEFTDLIMSLNYGLTDKLTVGVKIPYYWNRTDVRQAMVDNSTATVGKNPYFGQPGDPFGVPVIPLQIGGTPTGAIPFTTNDVQNLLVNQFGYKRVESWSGEGFSDIEVGGRYQYYKSENWRLAFTGGVRLPTGKVDDPDNLVDVGFGTGTWALLFRLNQDFTGVNNLVLNATLKFDLTLPDKQVKRVPSNVNEPITANKEEVNRNQGDTWGVSFSGSYEFYRGCYLLAEYEYLAKSKDKVSGNMGFNYQSLEDETDRKSQRYAVGAGYSTIGMFTEKKFPVPMTADLTYENVFAGKNNTLEQKYLSLKLAVYF